MAEGAKRRLRRAAAALVGGISVGVATVAGAAVQGAGPVRLAWSTYLRAGPAPTSVVLDELEHGVAVVVTGCGPRWCRVTADGLGGFVDRDALALPAPPAPAVAGRTDCALSEQADGRRPASTRFCSAAVDRR